MGFTCKIFGHKWNGCKCEKCGTEKYPLDVEIALARSGSTDIDTICEAIGRITNHEHFILIANESKSERARMWAAGELERSGDVNGKKVANDVYGKLRYSSDPMVKMAASQSYKPN